MFKNNLISILDLTSEQQEELFDLAREGRSLFSKYRHALDDKVLCSLFFQPSTRTQFSFQSAFVRLGGQYIGCSDINQTRSGAPYYEPLCDMGKIISNYCDIIVMRTIDDLQTSQLLEGCHVPFISGGSGNVEHPTQALTDLFTIQNYIGKLVDTDILIVGTPRQRTINSFIKGIAAWGTNRFHILCQSGISIPENVKKHLGSSIVKYYTTWEELYHTNITKSIPIIYMDKIFYETHFNNSFVPHKHEFNAHFSSDTLILHPLPRTAELPTFLDELKGANYFQQAQNGLYVRTALFLKYLIE